MDPSQRRARAAMAIMATICAALAVFCVTLAIAWAHAHDAARCWRAAFEADDTPAAHPCGD